MKYIVVLVIIVNSLMITSCGDYREERLDECLQTESQLENARSEIADLQSKIDDLESSVDDLEMAVAKFGYEDWEYVVPNVISETEAVRDNLDYVSDEADIVENTIE
ncbi:MAG: hypothetical protein Q4P13_08055 [Psychrobacter sp.]|nr:hypothetical protein [Psychrobacter sp.]